MLTITPDTLRAEALEQFLKLCDIKTYPAKCNIIKPGDIGDRLYYIINGAVSVSFKHKDAHELILAYLNKGDFIGEIGVFKSVEIRSVSVDTRSRSQVAEIPYLDFKLALKNQLAAYAVELLFVLSEQLSSRLLITGRKYGDLAFMDVEGRIARTLLDLCNEPEAMSHPEGTSLTFPGRKLAG